MAEIWAAMQSAGTRSGKNVQQVIQPAGSAEQAQPYLAGLISQRCDLIVTVGSAFGQAVPALAKADPAARFVTVDASLTGAPGGVTLLGGDGAAARVGEQVQGLRRAGGAGG
ncbi:hypothetical protein ACFZB9_10870 [Kitasatospora sp. NPDC008050]|uniref:hypothetical protein n=1 Tax=Kitasatospora sp. NPDC008050 TaxID=3364021 RepID=UPI0036E8688F